MKTLPSFVDRLIAAGLDPESAAIAAVAALERKQGPLSAQDRLKAELTVDEALLAQGVERPMREWDSSMGSLPPERRTQVNAHLKHFDTDMRALQWDYVNGKAEGSDYFESWEALKRKRQEAFMAELGPEEQRSWIVQESAQAKELRELPVDLLPAQLDKVAVAKYEAAQALAAPNLTDQQAEEIKLRLQANLRAALNEAEYAQLKRAETPTYEAYRKLSQELGITQADADTLFDWQQHVYNAETALRTNNLPDDEVIREMRAVVTEATKAIQQGLTAEQFAKFMARHQSVFLNAYQPLTEQ